MIVSIFKMCGMNSNIQILPFRHTIFDIFDFRTTFYAIIMHENIDDKITKYYMKNLCMSTKFIENYNF